MLCLVCPALCSQSRWMSDVVQIIQLEGMIWQKELVSLEKTIPRRIRLPWTDRIRKQIQKNTSGYIILTEEGLIIDAYYSFRYKTIIVRRVELINNTVKTGWVLRVHLITCEKSRSGPNEGQNIEFFVDLYMPARMELEEADVIRRIILSKSNKYLVDSEFYDPSEVYQY